MPASFQSRASCSFAAVLARSNAPNAVAAAAALRRDEQDGQAVLQAGCPGDHIAAVVQARQSEGQDGADLDHLPSEGANGLGGFAAHHRQAVDRDVDGDKQQRDRHEPAARSADTRAA